jgi:hypothetical protein
MATFSRFPRYNNCTGTIELDMTGSFANLKKKLAFVKSELAKVEPGVNVGPHRHYIDCNANKDAYQLRFSCTKRAADAMVALHMKETAR